MAGISMTRFTRKEVFLLKNTLSVIPWLLRGQSILIDQRNETSVAGIVENSDGFMNITLCNAVFIDRNGLQYYFEEYMVRERMIRYIHLTPEHGIEQAIRSWHEIRKKPKAVDNRKCKPTFKQKRAERRHKEILQEIIKGQESQQVQEKAMSTI